MKRLDVVKKALNDTLKSLQSTLELLDETKDNGNPKNSSKYDEEMTEEEKKVYEEEYVKVGEPLANTNLRMCTPGDWVKMWLEPYQKRQIVDIFYPLVDYLLRDECEEHSQFNQYNRYKIYDDLRTVTSSMLNKPLKEDDDTQDKLSEILKKIYPKNRKLFWETINKVNDVFSVKLSDQVSLKTFIQDKKNELENKLVSIKKKYEDDLKKMMSYYHENKNGKLCYAFRGIQCAFNGINIYSSEVDRLSFILSKIEVLLKEEKNDKHIEILQRFYDDIEDTMS